MNIKTYLIEEKYNPDDLETIILPERLKSLLNGIKESGNITSYLFSGPGGTGKTTSAVALCKVLGLDYEIWPCSINNKVDYVNEVIARKAENGSLYGDYKVIIGDEADRLYLDAQQALRNIMSGNLNHCRWILTANFPEKIIDPLKTGRTPLIDFSYSEEEKKEVVPILFKRLVEICDSEGIKIDNKNSFAKFVFENIPNIRFILKSIQMIAVQNAGKIPENITIKREQLTLEYFKTILNSDYKELTRFVNKTPQTVIMRFIDDNLDELVKDPEKQLLIMQYAANFQGLEKGVESIYTKAFLLNLKKIIGG